MKNLKIMLDAGHGGKDTGNISPYSDMKEKDMTLVFANMVMYNIINNIKNISLGMTRFSDVYLSMDEKLKKIKDYDMIISFHFENCMEIRTSNNNKLNILFSEIVETYTYMVVSKYKIKFNGITISDNDNMSLLKIPFVSLSIGNINSKMERDIIKTTPYLKDLSENLSWSIPSIKSL